jgi:hypothetical protein
MPMGRVKNHNLPRCALSFETLVSLKCVVIEVEDDLKEI